MGMLGKQARARLGAWWDGEDADRPAMLVIAPGERGGPAPDAAPDDYWTSPEVLVAETQARQRRLRFYGEAAPLMYVDYGASAVALQMGGRAGWTSKETIWCDPCMDDVGELARCRRHGRWADIQPRAIELGMDAAAAAGMLFAPYCQGAAADTAAALMGAENLMYAMVDEPDAVHAGFERIKRDWIAEFQRFSAACAMRDLSLTGWHGIWAPGPTSAIQEDFSYMIGRAMFDEFCLKHIRDIVDAVPYSFYHLDGVGALKHLPSLCAIESLRVIQWQPGAGQGGAADWLHVARAILDSGKRCQLYASADEVDRVAAALGAKGLLLIVYASADEAARLCDRWRLEPGETR